MMSKGTACKKKGFLCIGKNGIAVKNASCDNFNCGQSRNNFQKCGRVTQPRINRDQWHQRPKYFAKFHTCELEQH